jgi:hypothetical protein
MLNTILPVLVFTSMDKINLVYTNLFKANIIIIVFYFSVSSSISSLVFGIMSLPSRICSMPDLLALEKNFSLHANQSSFFHLKFSTLIAQRSLILKLGLAKEYGVFKC